MVTTAPLDLAECRRIHEAMTPGPWSAPGPSERVPLREHLATVGGRIIRASMPNGGNTPDDAAGIAHEHNTYGALLARIEALEAGLTEACDLASGHNIPGHNDYEADDDVSVTRLRALVRP